MGDEYMNPTSRRIRPADFRANQRLVNRMMTQSDPAKDIPSNVIRDRSEAASREVNWNKYFKGPTQAPDTGYAPAPDPEAYARANVTNPAAHTGTPTRLLGPNVTRGSTHTDAQIATALAENKRAVAPGGMGTFSKTSAAQASTPMMPAVFKSPGVKNRAVTYDPRADANLPMKTVKVGAYTQKTIASQYGTGSSQVFDRNAAIADLVKRYPQLQTAGTPEHTAFLAHVNDPSKGLQSAYDNVDKILGNPLLPRNMATRQAAESAGSQPPPALATRSGIGVPGPAAPSRPFARTPHEQGSQFVTDAKAALQDPTSTARKLARIHPATWVAEGGTAVVDFIKNKAVPFVKGAAGIKDPTGGRR